MVPAIFLYACFVVAHVSMDVPDDIRDAQDVRSKNNTPVMVGVVPFVFFSLSGSKLPGYILADGSADVFVVGERTPAAESRVYRVGVFIEAGMMLFIGVAFGFYRKYVERQSTCQRHSDRSHYFWSRCSFDGDSGVVGAFLACHLQCFGDGRARHYGCDNGVSPLRRYRYHAPMAGCATAIDIRK